MSQCKSIPWLLAGTANTWSKVKMVQWCFVIENINSSILGPHWQECNTTEDLPNKNLVTEVTGGHLIFIALYYANGIPVALATLNIVQRTLYIREKMYF